MITKMSDDARSVRDENKSRHWLWVLILVSAAFVLRIFNLEITGFWMDEIHSAFGVDPTKSIAELLEYCKRDQPPFFFLLLRGWFEIFPFNDFYGRLFVILTGCLGVIAMYFLGRDIRSHTVGIMCAFITTINYLHIDMSRQMRFYPMVFLLSALSLLFYYRIFVHRKNRDFLFYILVTAALLNTHYFGIVVFVTQFLMLIILCFTQKITDTGFIFKTIASGIITALSFAHWLPVVMSDIGISEFHIQPLHWYFPFEYWWVYFQDPLACAVFIVLILVSVKTFYEGYKKNRQVELVAMILIGWILFSFLIPLIYSWIQIPMLEYKYTVIALPPIFVLIALGVTNLSNRWIAIGATALTLSAFASLLFFRPLYFRKSFEEWREVTAHVKKTDGNDQFVFSNYAWYFRYYFKQFGMQHQPFEPEYADFNKLVDQANRVYIITQTRYPDPGLNAAQAEYLNSRFEKMQETKFADEITTLYVRKNPTQ